MRLLVTNTKEIQAYAIIRALRPFAEHVVATMPGRSRAGQVVSYAAYSRLVDRRYPVRPPSEEWMAGSLQAENSADDEDYLEQILAICERERIDVIYPSTDSENCFFSKNKRVFRDIGVRIPIADFDKFVLVLDKLKTIRTAERIGVAVPRTFEPKTEDDVLSAAASIPPPWVVKPRSSCHGIGLQYVSEQADLLERYRDVKAVHGSPLIQEYIPGDTKQNFYVMAGPEGKLRFALCPRIRRYTHRLYRNSTASCVTATDHPDLPDIENLCSALGWKGGLTIQMKVDARDGKAKLMEANGRFGTHLWFLTELGINAPLLSVRMERGEDLGDVPDIPEGTLLLDPFDDLFGAAIGIADWAAYHVKTKVLRKAPLDPMNAPLPMTRFVGDYAADYFRRHDVRYHPTFRYFLSDVRPNAVALLHSARNAVADFKKIGM